MGQSVPQKSQSHNNGFESYLKSLPPPTRVRLEKLRDKGFFDLGEIVSRFPLDEDLLKSLENQAGRLEDILNCSKALGGYKVSFDKLGL